MAVLSVLDDKDAAGMLRELVPLLPDAVFTASRNPRALRPATLASLWSQLSGPPAELEADPRAALERARRARRPGGAVVATGSIYLVADLLSAPGRRGVGAVSARGPGVLQMVALVAVVVALVILVFFALGYLFGRMFL